MESLFGGDATNDLTFPAATSGFRHHATTAARVWAEEETMSILVLFERLSRVPDWTDLPPLDLALPLTIPTDNNL